MKKLLLIIALCWIPTIANAQLKKPQITGNIIADIKANTSSGNALIDQIKSVALIDLNYAKALADAISSPRAKIRSTCYAAWITVIQQSQGLTAGPNGTPLGDVPIPALITKIEKAAEVVDNLQPESEFMVNCQPAANLFKMSLTQFVAAVASGSIGAATLGIAP